MQQQQGRAAVSEAAIRVLYLNHVAVLGGGERGLLGLVAHLDRSQYEPVVGLPSEGPLGDDMQRLKVRCIPVAMSRYKKTLNPWRLLLYFVDYRSVVRSLVGLIRSE